jgi:hypothetical protein
VFGSALGVAPREQQPNANSLLRFFEECTKRSHEREHELKIVASPRSSVQASGPSPNYPWSLSPGCSEARGGHTAMAIVLCPRQAARRCAVVLPPWMCQPCPIVVDDATRCVATTLTGAYRRLAATAAPHAHPRHHGRPPHGLLCACVVVARWWVQGTRAL